MVYMVRVCVDYKDTPDCYHFSHKREAYYFARLVSAFKYISSVSVLYFNYSYTDFIKRSRRVAKK